MTARFPNAPRQIAAALLLAALAACGADGPPERPEPREEAQTLSPGPNIVVTGSVGFGVTGGSTNIDLN